MLPSQSLGICRGCSKWLTKSLRREAHRIPAARPAIRKYSSKPMTATRPFRVAIVGSGPAGFYAAYRLLGKVQNATVDMYEQLPVPFGLVRYGVAPDHPEVKNCQDKFTEVAESPRFNFIGNVELGAGLPLQTLKPHYDAILFSYGASRDRELRIPGERDTKGVFSARAFVGWYNGLPEHRDLNPDLASGEDAVVIGQGNVALDVARILLTDVDDLRKTDMSEHALESLAKSKIKRVRIVGRRGPMQAAFTIKELRELIQIPAVSFEPIPKHLFPPDSTISSLPRAQKRLTQLLAKGSPTPPESAAKSWSLNFLLSPHSFHTSPSNPKQLSYIKFTRNHLDPADPFAHGARVLPLLGEDGKAMKLFMPASLCFRSIGYQSLPLPGFKELNIPFDIERGLIPNDGYGRVLNTPPLPAEVEDDSNSFAVHVPGIYCAGWVKRGPTGVIASTMTDAFTTADAMAADWEAHSVGETRADGMGFLNSSGEGGTGLGWDGVRLEAEKLGLRPTNWRDWEEIDRVEKERGQGKGKIREKFARVEEMLNVLS